MRGRIIKGVGGLYSVAPTAGSQFPAPAAAGSQFPASAAVGARFIAPDTAHQFNDTYACSAAGIFRLKKITPVIGDICEFTVTDEKDKEGAITNILPRKNELPRPRVSNIDQIIAVMAFEKPAADLTLLDKYLVFLENIAQSAAEPFEISVLINKYDLAEKSGAGIFPFKEHCAAAGYNVLYFSAVTGEGLDALYKCLDGKLNALAGASGVGKSSIVNFLTRAGKMETGGLSEKIARGKHTTRHVELIRLGLKNTYITDTPGFSTVSLDNIEKSELQHLFPEFEPFFGKCGFNDCMHINEPDCAVKEQTGTAIRPERYESYVTFYNEISQEGGR